MEPESENLRKIPLPPMWWMEARTMSAEQMKELEQVVGKRLFVMVTAAQFTYMRECAVALEKYYRTIEEMFTKG